MKTRTNILVVALCSLILLSCKKDEIAPYKMTASIGGEEWKTRVPVGVQKGDIFTVNGTSLDGKIIMLTINGAEAKTYTLDPLNAKAQCTIIYKESASTSDEDAYTGYEGSITVSAINTSKKQISGTFEFTLRKVSDLTQRLVISDGTFDEVRYTIQ